MSISVKDVCSSYLVITGYHEVISVCGRALLFDMKREINEKD